MKKYAFLLISTAILFLLSFVIDGFKTKYYDIETLTQNLQTDFYDKNQVSVVLLENAINSFSGENEMYFYDEDRVRYFHQYYDREGQVLLISKGDSVLFLSNNALPVDDNILHTIDPGINHMSNGWYFVNSQQVGQYTFRVFSLVKKDYRYKNRFLVNEFYKDFDIPDAFGLSDDTSKAYPIYTGESIFAFSIVPPPKEELMYVDDTVYFIVVLFSVLGIVALLSCILLVFDYLYNRHYKIVSIIGLFTALFMARFVMFYYHIPRIFYDGSLFLAGHYATSHLLPSLGDLFFNVILVNVFLCFCYFKTRNHPFAFNLPNTLKSLISFLLLGILAFYSVVILHLLEGLVINSHLNLNVNFIFNLDIYSVIGFLVIAGFFFSYYFLASIVITIVKNTWTKFKNLVFLALFSMLVFFAICFMVSSVSCVLCILLYATLFVFLFENHDKAGRNLSLSHLVISFFLFALIATYALFLFNRDKEFANRENVALRISSDQDPIAEFLFHDMEDNILDDDGLRTLVLEDPYDESTILTYLKSQYFDEFWDKYDIQVTICAPGEELIFKPFDVLMVCDDYFSVYIEDFGKPTLSQYFIYLDNNTGRNSYISAIPIFDIPDDLLLYTLYLEFEAKFIPKELGFPELLVDEQIDITRNLGDYSYAIYKNDKLTNRFGSFLYSVSASVYGTGPDDFKFFEQDGYSHILYERDADTVIMVSKPKDSLLEKIAPFSYLFILFTLIVVIVWITALYGKKQLYFHINFKKRLQFSMIAIVLISVLAIGSSSAWFIFNIYKNKNEAFIHEKAHSILIEMENRFSEEPSLDYTYSDYLQELLISLSHVFFTDINIFTPEGNLLASSRPRVFDEGLISSMINPVAYSQLKISRKSLFVHNERIGNLEYISAYVPLRNINNQLIAYINLPYFAQQSELRNEISYFLVAFINIYLLLLLLTIIIAFFISNYVTRPLQIIRKSLSSVTFGKANKKIQWTKKDEIGQLIGEYNRMIDELAISAELLARSERESAWREMAKQVAHEIKNPLTPMRLSVQYLQRAWNDKMGDWDERLDKFTKTMVEQIDTLSLIATEFSDFAKMPTQKNEIIELNTFIPEVLDLYKDFDNVKIEYHCLSENTKLFVSVDRKQLLRVFNNLIKNAIQAYKKDAVAQIHITSNTEGKFYKIVIQDYGQGIPEKLQDNIFQPYFTTKTAGMGLGLAMVKSIIQSFNGHISFTSQMGIGTSFIIRLPALESSEKGKYY